MPAPTDVGSDGDLDPTDVDRLRVRADEYLHAAPRSGSNPEEIGPFTLFRSNLAWPYYARPRPGAPEPTTADLERLIDRCRALDLAVSIEWVVETAPSLGLLAQRSGLHVEEFPLLVLERDDFRPVDPPPGASVDLVPLGADRLAEAAAVAHVSFGVPGTAVASQGIVERDAKIADLTSRQVADSLSRAARGLTISVVARDENDEVVASGSHQPVGAATEIVGVATLPSHRHRGYGSAVTSRLVEHALSRPDLDLVLLSAGSDDVARVYERIGFRRIGHAGAAEASSEVVHEEA